MNTDQDLINNICTQIPPPFVSKESAEILLKIWREEWRELQQLSAQLPVLPEYDHKCQIKDRFIDVRPSQHRVCLNGSNDYINADRACSGGPSEAHLILTQAPLSHTKVDFARMLVEQQVNLVLCLSPVDDSEEDYLNFIDRPLPNHQPKCKFMSTRREQNFILGQSLKVDLYDSCVSHNGSSQNLVVIRVTNWPDRQMPEKISDLVHLLEYSKVMLNSSSLEPPTVVIHCKAGIGRTGVMSVAWRMLEALNSGSKPDSLQPTYEWVYQLRQFRRGVVQNFEQYVGLQILRTWLLRSKPRTH